MGLFRKKTDPISERTRDLTDQIAALEQQIASLADKLEQATAEEAPAPPPERHAPEPVAAAPQPNQPRLRSTALPRSKGVIVHATSNQGADPVFEEINANPFKGAAEAEPEAEEEPELGVRKRSFWEFWRRITNHFRGPPATNPKLLSYLAAGSIQGLRPLRYEKRVARNRVLVLVAALLLILWGIVSFFLAHR